MNIEAKPGLPSFWTPILLTITYILRKIHYLLAIWCIAFSSATAQDIHFSQFYFSPYNMNPALTGIFGGDIRFNGLYRNQWASVPVDYMTFSGGADMKFLGKNAQSGFFSGGINFNYDRAGLSKLQLMDLGLSGSYTKNFSPTFFVTLGARAAFGQRSFKLEELSFGNQYDELREWYDPNLATGETFPGSSNMYIDFSAGVNFRLQALQNNALVDRLDKRTKVDIGFGFFHVNQPDQSFYDADKAPLTTRVSPYVLATLQVSKNLDVLANLNAQFQNPYKEYLGMLGVKYHVNRQLGKQIALQLGGTYRFNEVLGDAVFPSVAIYYNTLRVGLSYDINLSEFNVATLKRGGPEFSIQYIIKRVRPLPEFKICPII